MSKPEFTPGPWKRRTSRPRKIVDGCGKAVATAVIYNGAGGKKDRGKDDYEALANARLIAASPCLYRELDMQVRNCPSCKGTGEAVDVIDMLEGSTKKTECTRCKSARAAIRKAREATND